MSKNFGKSRRAPVLDKEDKRPSVFERLGVRSRDSSVVGSGPDSHGHGPPPRWSSEMKPGHSQNRDRQRIPPDIIVKRRSRSPSYSPPSGTKPRSVGRKMDDIGSPLGRPESSASAPKGKKKVAKDSPNKLKGKSTSGGGGKKDKTKKRSSTSLIKNKSKKKTKRASSGSSNSSGSDSSSSTSRSSSSSSSSSSNNSSSSDSSVPSIKLKSEKKSKPSKKKPFKPNKEKKILGTGTGAPIGKFPSSKSSSSGMDTPISGGMKRNIDLREKLNARSPRSPSAMSMTRGDSYKERGGGGGGMPKQRHYDRSGPYSEEHHDMQQKKRLLPHDSYQQDDVKRKRMMSPEDKYRAPPMENHRRAPPQQHDNPNMMKRGRTPPGLKDGQQIHPHHRGSGSHSPMRRGGGARPEDMRRNERDFRNEPHNKRPPFPPQHGGNFKARDPREFDRRREPGPEYGRDNRPGPGPPSRERMAPTRPMDRPDNRDRGHPAPDFQRRPPPQRPPYNQQPGGNYRGQYDKDRPRYPPMDEKRGPPMLPKSKEALSERYEQVKKSGYVDKWVDETVKAVQRNVPDVTSPEGRPPLLPLPGSKPFISGATGSTTSKSDKGDNKDIESKDVVKLDAEDLSDFSDDADEILNNESLPVPETPKSVKSSSEIDDSKKDDKSSGAKPRSVSIDTAPSVKSQNQEKEKVHSQNAKTLIVPADSGKSLPSQSQTDNDDDILERMDFEEISEDELGEVENKIHIVDALGVDWASLVQEKQQGVFPNTNSDLSNSARKRWSAANVLSQMGMSKKLLGDSLYNRVLETAKASGDDKKIKTENNCVDIIDKIGLGRNSRALSSRRDMAMRRHFLDLPQKNLLSLDSIHQPPSNPSQEMDSVGELYKLSIALFNTSKREAVVPSVQPVTSS